MMPDYSLVAGFNDAAGDPFVPFVLLFAQKKPRDFMELFAGRGRNSLEKEIIVHTVIQAVAQNIEEGKKPVWVKDLPQDSGITDYHSGYAAAFRALVKDDLLILNPENNEVTIAPKLMARLIGHFAKDLSNQLGGVGMATFQLATVQKPLKSAAP